MQNAIIARLSIIIVIQAIVKAQYCLQTETGMKLPSFRNYRGDTNGGNRITQGHQAIIPSYKFVCDGMCGNITEWGVDVHPGGNAFQNRYTLDLQVWRPSPTVDDSTATGQYSLVGNNRFTSISLSDGVARLTPSPQDYIQFQPGDVLGFYVDCIECRNRSGVVVLTSPSNFTSVVVWFGRISPSLTSSQITFSIGSSGDLYTSTRAAPVISISTMPFSCPPVATILSTPPPQPTTNVNDTPLPTTQEPQQPTVQTPSSTSQEPQQPTLPQKTTNSLNDNNGQTQTLSSSEVITTTGVLSGVSTTSEAVSDQEFSSGGDLDIGLVTVIVSVVIALIAVTLIVTLVAIALIIRKNKRKSLSTSVPTDAIQNNSDKMYNEDNVYSHPEVILDNVELQTKPNKACATTISTETNVAYCSTNIMVIEENEAYITKIVRETNKAYAPGNIVTVTTENRYIYENEPEDEYY